MTGYDAPLARLAPAPRRNPRNGAHRRVGPSEHNPPLARIDAALVAGHATERNLPRCSLRDGATVLAEALGGVRR
jgi:hypothetical protein